MKLLIDSSDVHITKVSLDGEQGNQTVTVSRGSRDQVLLKTIIDLLDQNNKKLSDLKGVDVFTGPGSFTGLRVGTAIANALGYGLDIKVNGKKAEYDLTYT